MFARAGITSFLIFAALARVSSGGVITVDSAGGSDFTEIQPAIDASSNGDIVLIAAGDYSKLTSAVGQAGAVVDGKSLTLVADAPGSAVTVSWLRITNVGVGQRVVVRGFHVVDSGPTLAFGGAEAFTCAGAVVFEDCAMTGGAGFLFFHSVTPGRPGLKLTNVASATVARCTLIGGTGVPGQSSFGYPPGDGGAGLEISGSSVAVHDSTATGGVNWPVSASQAGNAGPGVRLGAGQLVSSGCAMNGGSALLAGKGQGGAGLLLTAPSAAAWLTETVAVGGPGVNGTAAAIVAGSGIVYSLPGLARSLAVTSPAHPGDPVTVDLDGAQNDLVLFFVSTTGGFYAINGLQGVLTFGLPVQGAFVLASITAPSGHASLVAPAPQLVPGVTGFTFVLHPIFINGASAFAGSPSAFTLVQ